MRDTAMRLRHARKLRGLTQDELATKSGIKQGSISDLERGESKTYRGATLVALAHTLKVSPEWLAQGRGAMERKDVPLSDGAIALAQAWQRLAPELQESTAKMIFTMAEQIDKYGPAVADAKVEAAYGRPGKATK